MRCGFASAPLSAGYHTTSMRRSIVVDAMLAGYSATTTRGRKWAQLAGILTGDQKVDLFDHLRAFKRHPVPTVEKLRGARAILYWTRR